MTLSDKILFMDKEPAYLQVKDVKEFIKQDYKNTVLAKRGEITWQDYARMREELLGEELTK